MRLNDQGGRKSGVNTCLNSYISFTNRHTLKSKLKINITEEKLGLIGEAKTRPADGGPQAKDLVSYR